MTSYRIVSEAEFDQRVADQLHLGRETFRLFKSVIGPGRSGAIAAVYVSHKLGIPFLAWGQEIPEKLKPVLVVDTATWTGRTLRKAAKRYQASFVAFYVEKPGTMVKFWYEKGRCPIIKNGVSGLDGLDNVSILPPVGVLVESDCGIRPLPSNCGRSGCCR